MVSAARRRRRKSHERVDRVACPLVSDADSGFTVGEIIAVTGGPTDTR
ncbi:MULTISPECIES: hypothetical protein [Streptomyces]